MQATEFLDILGADFFVGVPDSQLRALCDALMERYASRPPHIVAANEGTAAGIAAGHYLAGSSLFDMGRRKEQMFFVFVQSFTNGQIMGFGC